MIAAVSSLPCVPTGTRSLQDLLILGSAFIPAVPLLLGGIKYLQPA